MSLFEKATRKNFTFASPRGKLIVQDLWGLPLTSNNPKVANLNAIAVGLYEEIQAMGSKSFVRQTRNPRNDLLQDKLNLIKHIIQVREAEMEQAKANKEKVQARQAILEALAKKEQEEINSLSAEELRTKLQEMDGTSPES